MTTVSPLRPSDALPNVPESARLEALRRYQIVETPRDRGFDDIAVLAARLCHTPMALVSFVEAERVWVMSSLGLEVTESPRNAAFCALTVAQADLVVVHDAALDPRFAGHPLVTGPAGVRFYAGYPLLTEDGHAIGTICVLDCVPRALTTEQGLSLRALSRLLVTQLELRKSRGDAARALDESRTAAEAYRESEELKTRLIEGSQDCIKVLDLDGRLLSMNAGGMAALEICDLGPLIGQSWIEFWGGDDRRSASEAVATARRGETGRFTGYFETTQTHRPAWWDVVVNPIVSRDGCVERLLAVSRDVTEAHAVRLALQEETAGRQRLNALFHLVTEATATVGEAFFPALARHLAQALEYRYAFVAECLDAQKTRVRMLAFWMGDRFEEPVEFDLAGTPCCRVVQEGAPQRYSDQVAELFPADKPLEEMGVRSYLGLPMTDSAGEVNGHFVLLDDRPRSDDPWVRPALELFASRAGAELERLHAERLRRQAMAELERVQGLLHAENAYLRSEVEQRGGDGIIGDSAPIARMLEQVNQVAPTDSTVLILGETGTGKELVARAIHVRSPRQAKPMVCINCGAISPGLVESELFGHERGAFTGATSRRIGRFELADGGTIFLDEIGDLPLDLQVRLLRVIQEGELVRVGGTQPIRVNVRIIAATHRNLQEALRSGKFRDDLYYRLNVFPIRTPALRDRVSDLPALTRFFVDKCAARMGKRIDRIPPQVLEALSARPWPGNVRELANVIEHSVIVTRGPVLELAEDLGRPAPPGPSAPEAAEVRQSMEDMERAHIVQVLTTCGWRVSGPGGAAEVLALKPTTLESRMKKLGIVRPR